MCKDYTSLEIAAFIIRFRVLAKKCVLLPLVFATEAQPEWKKGVKMKVLFVNISKFKRTHVNMSYICCRRR